MKFGYPFVSIITVNFNQVPVTRDFLKSIRQITYPNYEVIVVDNASQQPGFDALMDEFEGVNFIQSPENLGFAGGNNLGTQLAQGEYLLYINNDTEVDPGFLEPLVKCMQQNPQIGISSPKIKFFHHPDTIQYAGGNDLNPYTGRGRFTGYHQRDHDRFNQTQPTRLIHGAAMLVSRSMMQQVGQMEEMYFLYYEELDWGERAKRAGYLLYYVADSVVYHKASVTTGKNSPLKVYYQTRNRLLFMRRNFTGLQLLSSVLFFLFFSIPKALILLSIRRQFSLVKAYLRAVYWHAAHIFTQVPPKQNHSLIIPLRSYKH
jgi:GT2 family glycosyltransferase